MRFVILGNSNFVELLLNFNANSNIKDFFNNTPLYYAKKYGYYNIAQMLYFKLQGSKIGNQLKNINKMIQRKIKIYKNMKRKIDVWDIKDYLRKYETDISDDVLSFYIYQRISGGYSNIQQKY